MFLVSCFVFQRKNENHMLYDLETVHFSHRIREVYKFIYGKCVYILNDR